MLSALLIFTRSLPAFVGATTSATPHHCASLRRLRSAPFRRVRVCRPICFGGCSFAQPSGLAPRPSPALYLKTTQIHNQGISYYHRHPDGSRRALCPKSRFAYGGIIFFPRRFTLAVLLSTARAPFRSRPAVAVRLPQHRHCAPHKKFRKNSIFCCGAWGCFLNIDDHPKIQKIKKVS